MMLRDLLYLSREVVANCVLYEKIDELLIPNCLKQYVRESEVYDLQVLKEFDLDERSGHGMDCCFSTRLQRWVTARREGLYAPRHVKEILDRHRGEEVFIHCMHYETYASRFQTISKSRTYRRAMTNLRRILNTTKYRERILENVKK